MESVAVTGAAAGVTDCGLKPQLAPLGRPEQAKLTDCLNPFAGVTVRVIVPMVPELTVRDAPLIDSE